MLISEKAELFRSWLEEKNINDIEVIDVSGIAADMDAFVIGTSSNDRQSKAVAEYIEEKAEEQGFQLIGREGVEAGRWILLDYVDIVVHIFLKEERELYNLEKLWADGKFIGKPKQKLSEND
ncbi:MAG: ribosome silencing factor [Anaerofustis sp.]